jgi:hypothetical protein
MSSHPTWFKGDRDPSISDQVTVDGVGVDLSAKSVQFRMRAVGSSTLKVDAPVTFKDASGNWRYDWATNDLDTAGSYLVWVAVTTGSKVETVNEALIRVLAHGGASAYVELEELKSTSELTGTTFQDQDMQEALVAASRAVDTIVGRRFFLDVDANQIRYYTARRETLVDIDDLTDLTAVAIDRDGDGTYEETWVEGTDFVLEPRSAELEGQPWRQIRHLATSNFGRFPQYPERVRVTGQFGWGAIPEGVKVATKIIATRFVKRKREAPFGIAGIGADGVAVRIAKDDPDVQLALSGLSRRRLFH